MAEAVKAYRASELEARLEDAYREDAEESERLNRPWKHVDAAVAR